MPTSAYYENEMVIFLGHSGLRIGSRDMQSGTGYGHA